MLDGGGTAFSAGMDLKEAAGHRRRTRRASKQTVATLKEFADLLQWLHTLPKPTIAAVNGDALAGGAGLMAACDLAIAAETRPDRLPGGPARAGRRRSSCTT